MFFHLNLYKDIEVEPRYFGPRLQEILKQKVTSEVTLFEALANITQSDSSHREEIVIHTVDNRQIGNPQLQ